MAYAPPTIGLTGLVAPSYTDIINFYVSQFQNIYGQNVYLGNDSADFQLLSILALAASDSDAALQQAYNNQSPLTATGAGLSLLVALNGLSRLVATNSTCLVTLTGTAGTVVSNGVIQNNSTADLWNLPATVTIGGGGTVTVLATAQQAGAVNATANQLTQIVTPTSGWTSVTNGSNVPSLGAPVEADNQLRLRQQASVALPALTIADSTIAAILSVPGVTRINNNPKLSSQGTTSFENFTGSADDWGNPAHSISPVVQGGDPVAIATAIYNKRGLGPKTNGSTGGTLVTENITSPKSGLVTVINFATPASQSVYVSLEIHIINTNAYTSGVLGPLVTAALVAYISSLPLGPTISFGELVAAANSINPVGQAPLYSVLAANFFFGTSPSPSTNTDVTLSFYQVPVSVTGNIVITFV